MKNRLSLIVVLGMSLGVVACDTDYGSLDKNPYPSTYPIAGIWNGTFTYTPPDNTAAHPVNVTLVADESNEMWMIEQDTVNNCVHLDYGNAYSKQSDITGSFGYSSSCTNTDLSNYGTGTITGTVDYHVTLTLSVTETDSKNFLYATFSPAFTFNDMYLAGSALATVAGAYADATGGAVSIDGSGTVTGATLGSCTATASLALIDSNYNLYRVSYALAGCTAGADAHLTGVTMSGLGFLDSTAHQFIFALHGTDTSGQAIVASDVYTAT